MYLSTGWKGLRRPARVVTLMVRQVIVNVVSSGVVLLCDRILAKHLVRDFIVGLDLAAELTGVLQ